MSKPHIVLVHGAFHRAWHFHLLQRCLEDAGYRVSAPDLPSTKDDTLERGALAADAAVIRNVIEEAATASDSILPVFHSYGGVAGSGAVAQLSPYTAKKITRLVFLASFVVQCGSSVEELIGYTLPPDTGRNSHIMIHPSPIPYFYHDLDPTLAEEAARHLGPQARSAMTDTVKHAGWKAFPRTLIQCDDDRAILWDMFALSEQDRAGWEIIKIEGGHSPFLSRPEEVAGVLRRIAGESL